MGRSLCLSLALLFLANIIPSKAQSDTPTTEAAEAVRAGDASKLVEYEIGGAKSNFTLLCELQNDNDLKYTWKKNDTALEQVHELKARFKLENGDTQLVVTSPAEDDFGNYSCSLSTGVEQRWTVRGKPRARLPSDSNVVEGQKLKLVCKVIGKPYPTVTWSYTNSTEIGANYTDVTELLGDRVTLAVSEQGVPNGVMMITAAQRSDAGRYNCTAGDSTVFTHVGSTMLRVKDMYAALWPFLGICAEVFILCAIILVYEKRRTKPELDDSDTDNHDQKKS